MEYSILCQDIYNGIMLQKPLLCPIINKLYLNCIIMSHGMCMHACVPRTHTHMHTHNYTHTHASTHVHACTCARAHTHTHTHTHTHMRTHTHAHTHMYTHIHTHRAYDNTSTKTLLYKFSLQFYKDQCDFLALSLSDKTLHLHW